ncbi:MAG TPA: NfeD family protein [Gammaproteobacteria bacterium]|nr:NfeD family protein [Gammaproteobacteria bacterium]
MDAIHLDYWHWWIIAVVLMTLEALLPGFIFLWMGAAAAVVGVWVLLFPDMSWEIQLLIFSLLSIIAIVAFKLYQRRNPTQTDKPTLSRRGERYVGRTFVLDQPMRHGQGKIKVDDSIWRVSGPDLPVGTKIKVVALEGNGLIVEAVAE